MQPYLTFIYNPAAIVEFHKKYNGKTCVFFDSGVHDGTRKSPREVRRRSAKIKYSLRPRAKVEVRQDTESCHENAENYQYLH